jgi:anti-anti-sigma factor
VWRSVFARRAAPAVPVAVETASLDPGGGDTVDIQPDDPLVTYFIAHPGAVDLQEVHLESRALRAMKAAGFKLAVPLVAQGELLGVLNLGPRLSEQEYSADDRALLNNLASQATPALRVAQLVRAQQEEARERDRIEQEMRVARLIQQSLIPRELPKLEGWRLAAHYQPARAVGGDFYDFIDVGQGRLGLVIGDVTDKGVPAALVMATTRSELRAAAATLVRPGAVLRQVNTKLGPDIPASMFVTCLFAVLDPHTGRLVYANAGHDLPYRRTRDGVVELSARGMPLGLLPDMEYEEVETDLRPGEAVLLYSDGLVEAHNHDREMFSFPRLRDLVAENEASTPDQMIEFLLARLGQFTGPAWEQEDDITLVTLQRSDTADARPASGAGPLHDHDHRREAAAAESGEAPPGQAADDGEWETIADFCLRSEPGNERTAIERVREALQTVGLPGATLLRMETAVGEATMNAIEHGNRFEADAPVRLRVQASTGAVRVLITDRGGPIASEAAEPDLQLKLAGKQSPRGWGLFLIRNMVDDVRELDDQSGHTIQLTVNRDGDSRRLDSGLPIDALLSQEGRMSQTEELAVHAADGAGVIELRGELDASAEQALSDAFSRAAELGDTVVLNFEQLEYMNSSGIGLIVTLLIRAQRQKKKLVICRLSQHYRSIFHITRLDDAIPTFETEEEALEAI